MFDKLDDLILRYEEVMRLLSEPDVANDSNRFRSLMKEQSDLAPIVEAYKKYKEAKQTIEDSLEMMSEESDEDMKEMLKEELNDAKAQVEELENTLKKFVQVQVEMKQHYLPQKSIVCMYIILRLVVGRLRPWKWKRLVSVE